MPLFGQDIFSSLSRRVAILGPGLIGGSLAMALSRAREPWDVSVWARREEAAREAAGFLPGCRVTHDLAAALDSCDIAVLCMSPHAVESAGEMLKDLLPSQAVVTDAGSVKEKIVYSLESILGGRFVGAHPMAGSDQSGIQAARADLYQGAVCIITPTKHSHSEALTLTRKLWQEAGCSLREMDPVSHDHAIGRISHLPHAVAAALVQTALQSDPSIAELAGSGYRDSTRIAGGPAKMWAEILLDNRREISAGIHDLQNKLEALKIALERGDRNIVEAFLADARKLRINHPSVK